MTNSKLSPAAQAVWDAAWSDTAIQCGDIKGTRRSQVAAALRAAADQVVPEPSDLDKELFSIAALRLRWVIRDQFLAIADELENLNV